jgi:alpha-tubulin suppressor-like RCC1 family protein
MPESTVPTLAGMRPMLGAMAFAACMATTTMTGCGGNPTEIVLVIDADMPPREIESIAVLVRGPSGAEQSTVVPYDGGARTIGLRPAGEALGPVFVQVSASRGGTEVLRRTVRTSFEAGVSRVLHVRFTRACLGVFCPAGFTCDPAGGCSDDFVNATNLPARAGDRVNVPELCNGFDDDGDGRADEDFDLTRDTRHCGACYAACAPGLSCVASSCIPSPVAQVAAGSNHACLRRESGGVACWGGNGSGQLATGDTIGSTRPLTVAGLTDARWLCAGAAYTCAARATGAVVCWGSNSCGEGGRPDGPTAFLVPTEVPGVTDAVEVTCGYCHACARRSDGSVLCWGENMEGQIGDGRTSTSPRTATMVTGVLDARAVTAGAYHTCALRGDGRVSCWGQNSSGQVGDGTTLRAPMPGNVRDVAGVTAVAGGRTSTCAIAMTMTGPAVRCWGGNDAFQLGMTMAWDPASPPPTVPSTGGATALSMAQGGEFACAIVGGRAVCWGDNASGQLGDDTTENRATPVAVMGLPAVASVHAGDTFACAVTTEDEVWCWGGNIDGQCGNGTRGATADPGRVVGFGPSVP